MASKRRHRRRWIKKSLLGLLIVLIVVSVVNYFRPIPALTPTTISLKIPTTVTTTLQWPNIGNAQAAIGAQGYGLLATDGAQTQQPTASVAKLVTTLLVLKKYPLQINQTATPIITFGASDVALYQAYLAENGSVAKVETGEQLSEYQALQAMLLPSANNIADSLAIWAYGSLAQYAVAANDYLVNNLGLKNTTIGSDASGFLPSTTSTASDLTTLGLDALQNPVIAQIVAEKEALIPVAGTIYNVNQLLDQNGIVGIKTGNSDQAGGVYTFAYDDQLDPGHSVLIVGTIQGAPTLANSFSLGEQLINFAKDSFSQRVVVAANQEIGYYKIPWDKKSVSAVSATALTPIVWASNSPKPVVGLSSFSAPRSAGASVGSVNLLRSSTNSASARVILSRSVGSAPWWWRILRFIP